MLEQINIKEKVKAKINLATLSGASQKYGTGGPQGPVTATYGQVLPIVMLNALEIQEGMLVRLEIDCMGFMPKLMMTMDISKSKTSFLDNVFPRAGDVVSIFMRAPNDTLKPIRNDYEVISVDYIGGGIPGGAGSSLVRLTGRLFIPDLYLEKSFVENGTGYETLKKIASELSLGFASNEDNTDDTMKWYGLGNYENFINQVTDHVWKNEESFFTSFIDFYYNLNLVNVNKQFTFSLDGQPGVISDLNIRVPDEEKTLEIEQKIFSLTNNPNYSSRNNFINDFNIINNATLITAKEGILKDYSFYDFSSKSFVLDSVPVLNTKDAPSTVVPLGIMKTLGIQPNKTWLGMQYSEPIGNVHKNYSYAKLINNFNLSEIEKIIVEVKLASPNFFIHKGQRLATIIYNYGDATETITSNNQAAGLLSTKTPGVINRFLTGFYYVKGYRIIYDPTVSPGFSQVVYLTRREWERSTDRI